MLRFFRTQLEHRLQEAVSGNPGWAKCPSSGPHHTWAHLCRSTQVQISYFSGTQSLHWCCAKSVPASHSSLYHFPGYILPLPCIMPLPIFPLSLYHSATCMSLSFCPPSLYPSQPTYPQHIPLPTSSHPSLYPSQLASPPT